ncbi:plasmodesmata-located protein 3-like [Senna tora]|uniref:Plasmodesmata-located protein 3-like n=1 Tax=Senna tora TaxID=362788 RepID=A0A835C7Y0_9FABA|nr:plasmodesmata-located protein 3-like [Senna tora]
MGITIYTSPSSSLPLLIPSSCNPNRLLSSTTSGDGQNAITGLYQCRGDLTNSECYKCVSKIPDILGKLSGLVPTTRVQLNGCYLWCEVLRFRQVSGTQMLFKVCGRFRPKEVGSMREGRRRLGWSDDGGDDDGGDNGGRELG